MAERSCLLKLTRVSPYNAGTVCRSASVSRKGSHAVVSSFGFSGDHDWLNEPSAI